MAKLLIRSAALLLGAVVAVSASADTTMAVSSGPAYASDLFGPDADDLVLEYANGQEPAVWMVLKDSTDMANARATYEFTLTGATFATSVRSSNLSVRQRFYTCKQTAGDDTATDSTDDEFEWVVGLQTTAVTGTTVAVSEGRRGDNVVEFDLTIPSGTSGAAITPAEGDCDETGEIGNVSANGSHVVQFQLPGLTNTLAAMGPGGKGIKVTASASAITQSKALEDFPSVAQRDAATPETGKRTIIASAYTVSTVTGNIIPAKRGLTATIGAPESGKVSVLDRTTFTGLPSSRAGQFLVLGSVSLSLAADAVQSNGKPFGVGSRDDGAGVLEVMVGGSVRESDTVFVDINGDGKAASRGEMLSYDDDTRSFTGEFELDDLLTNADGDAVTSFPNVPPTAGKIIYMPDGKEEMRSGSLSPSAKVDYEPTTSRDFNVYPSAAGGRLAYGIGPLKLGAKKAYALAPMSSGDESNVRIRCESNADCSVWLSCDSAMGDNFFGMHGGKVPAWGTTTVTSTMIAETVGAEDADFRGRMSCEVIGLGLSVQVLTRSNDTLVNNTYVN